MFSYQQKRYAFVGNVFALFSDSEYLHRKPFALIPRHILFLRVIVKKTRHKSPNFVKGMHFTVVLAFKLTTLSVLLRLSWFGSQTF